MLWTQGKSNARPLLTSTFRVRVPPDSRTRRLVAFCDVDNLIIFSTQGGGLADGGGEEEDRNGS